MFHIPRPAMGDAPAIDAAKLMGLTRPDFEKELPQLLRRGFPAPDVTTGLFDLDAIVKWREQRFPYVYPPDIATARGPIGSSGVAERIRAAMGKP
jgi:hypothetical protein